MFGQFQIGDFEDSYMRLVSIAELPKNHDACGKCDRDSDDCVGVVGLENAGRSLYADRFTVRSFCIPLGMNHKVFAGTNWYIEDDSTQGALGGVSIASETYPPTPVPTQHALTGLYVSCARCP